MQTQVTIQGPTKYTYQAIAEKLRQQILTSPDMAGQQLPPEPQLASEYGVSRITLRKALDILGDEHLIVRQKGRGTFVSDEISTTAAKTLVFVGRVDGHFWRDLYLAVLTDAQRLGYSVSTILIDRLRQADQRRGIEQELSGHVAIVTTEALSLLHEAGIALATGSVVVGHSSDNTRCSTVAMDQAAAARIAVTAMIQQGHRRILWCGSTPSGSILPGVDLPNMRMSGFAGYVDALIAHGHEFDPRYCLAMSHDASGEDALNRIYELLDEKPTAFVCDADFRSVPVYKMARARGWQIPRDISIVALGNTPWSEMLDPPLSSVSLDEDGMARTAVGLLGMDLTQPLHLRVDPRLILRQSIGPAPSPN